jgi:hypothetical protein
LRRRILAKANCHLLRSKETNKCPKDICTPGADGDAEGRVEPAMRKGGNCRNYEGREDLLHQKFLKTGSPERLL